MMTIGSSFDLLNFAINPCFCIMPVDLDDDAFGTLKAVVEL